MCHGVRPLRKYITLHLSGSAGRACGAIEELDDRHPRVQDGLHISPAGVVSPQQLHDRLFNAKHKWSGDANPGRKLIPRSGLLNIAGRIGRLTGKSDAGSRSSRVCTRSMSARCCVDDWQMGTGGLPFLHQGGKRRHSDFRRKVHSCIEHMPLECWLDSDFIKGKS